MSERYGSSLPFDSFAKIKPPAFHDMNVATCLTKSDRSKCMAEISSILGDAEYRFMVMSNVCTETWDQVGDYMDASYDGPWPSMLKAQRQSQSQLTPVTSWPLFRY
jgi:hypothetical protein